METVEFLREATHLVGLPGYERGVAPLVRGEMEPLCDDVTTDAMGNVIGRIGRSGPRVMVSAHMDEIGLVVSAIEKDGCLRVVRTGGVDPRILPAMEVSVQAKDGPLYGVMGAKPPHLQAAGEQKKALTLDDLFIDVGFPADEVKKRVRVGDQVVMLAKQVPLKNGRMADKTMDDRAGVAMLLELGKLLRRMDARAQTFLVASTQEELGMRGAGTAAFGLEPDFAVAVDVTHGEGPDTEKFTAHALDKVVITTGANIHPTLYRELKDTAKENHVDIDVSVAPARTGTDAYTIQIARSGVPTVLISIPLRYMHTTVETLSADVIRESARLTALFIERVARKWEDLKWY